MLPQVVAFSLLVAFASAGNIGLGIGGLGLGGGLGLDGGLGLGGGLGVGGGLGLGGVGIGSGIGIAKQVVDVHTPAQYEFKYGVADPKTGDNKQQSEVRLGDTVKGQYSLAEPDGTIRVVKYTADPHNGFNAIVSRIGHAAHPQQLVKAVVPVATHGIAVGNVGLGGLGGGIGLGGLGGGIGLGGLNGGIGLGGLNGGIGLGGLNGGIGLGGHGGLIGLGGLGGGIGLSQGGIGLGKGIGIGL